MFFLFLFRKSLLILSQRIAYLDHFDFPTFFLFYFFPLSLFFFFTHCLFFSSFLFLPFYFLLPPFSPFPFFLLPIAVGDTGCDREQGNEDHHAGCNDHVPLLLLFSPLKLQPFQVTELTSFPHVAWYTTAWQKIISRNHFLLTANNLYFKTNLFKTHPVTL